ncbi:MAG: flagellar hook-length control protein FliK [Treponema sp.]|nr:flagellar hook-length control protein FliK [Treponema sp.]
MQTADVQFLSGKKNVAQNLDVEKTVKANENLSTNKKSFKSILESVKSEKVEEKQVHVDDKKSHVDEKEPLRPDSTENDRTAAQKGASQKNESVKKEAPAEKKNPKKSVQDEKSDETESNSITVELELDELATNDTALAESIASAAALVQGDETTSVENLALDSVAVDEVAGLSENAGELIDFADENYDSAAEPVSGEILSQGLASENLEEIEVHGEKIIPDESRKERDAELASDSSSINIAEETVDSQSIAAVETGSEPKSGEANTEKVDGKKATFTVIDQRTESVASEKIAASEEGGASENSSGTNLDSGNMFAAQDRGVQVQTAQNSGETFTQMLSQQIQNGAPDFVKAGSILLKDNNTGSINMVLKPENLGNVKVSLELSDKILSGQIVVQSREAYEAFRQNMDTLKQAFQNNGFENANLNLVLAENAGSNGSFAQGQQQSGEQFMANRTYSDFAQPGDAVDASTGSEMYTRAGDHQIDVVA